MKGAPNSVASIEELSDVELEELQKACHRHASETSGRAREYKKALATRRRGARQKTKKKARAACKKRRLSCLRWLASTCPSRRGFVRSKQE
jgi:hypothetical protein